MLGAGGGPSEELDDFVDVAERVTASDAQRLEDKYRHQDLLARLQAGYPEAEAGTIVDLALIVYLRRSGVGIAPECIHEMLGDWMKAAPSSDLAGIELPEL